MKWLAVLSLGMLACYPEEGQGTIRGFRTLKNGTRLVIFLDTYCPEGAVALTPSMEAGDVARITHYQACAPTLDKFEEPGMPNDRESADTNATTR